MRLWLLLLLPIVLGESHSEVYEGDAQGQQRHHIRSRYHAGRHGKKVHAAEYLGDVSDDDKNLDLNSNEETEGNALDYADDTGNTRLSMGNAARDSGMLYADAASPSPSRLGQSQSNLDSYMKNTRGKDFSVIFRLQTDYDYGLDKVETSSFQRLRHCIQQAVLRMYADSSLYHDTILLAVKNNSNQAEAETVIRFTKDAKGNLHPLTDNFGPLKSPSNSSGFLPYNCPLMQIVKAEALDFKAMAARFCGSSCSTPVSCWPKCDVACCGQPVSFSVIIPPVPPPPPMMPTYPMDYNMCGVGCNPMCAPSCSPGCCFVRKRSLLKHAP